VGPEDIFHAVRRVHERCRGAYAAVAMITGVGIVGFRDPHGIRPLVFGKRMSERGAEYVLASESVAIDVLGYKLVRDVRPGEAVFISVDGTLTTRECIPHGSHAPCIFEYVYLARPDSIIDGISVHKARMRMGEALARKVRRLWPEHDIDVVIPIPDTSRSAALQLAHELGIKYREGFIKNRYIPRTFIMPGQGMRRKSVRQKLNAIDLEFRGRNVMLVDDSIVRGTTCRQIIQMARDVGARKVYFASAAPPVRHPNVYGIDMPSVDELIAYNRTVDEVARLIGADWLVYQDLEDLIAAAHKGNPEVAEFDASCFSGEYVTGDVTAQYLDRLATERCDEAKAERSRALNSLVDLHDIA
ncbi:MAG: amidophosphoribosyltransferase, partial [Gammaproteobacteria bacterium]